MRGVDTRRAVTATGRAVAMRTAVGGGMIYSSLAGPSSEKARRTLDCGATKSVCSKYAERARSASLPPSMAVFHTSGSETLKASPLVGVTRKRRSPAAGRRGRNTEMGIGEPKYCGPWNVTVIAFGARTSSRNADSATGRCESGAPASLSVTRSSIVDARVVGSPPPGFGCPVTLTVMGAPVFVVGSHVQSNTAGENFTASSASTSSGTAEMVVPSQLGTCTWNVYVPPTKMMRVTRSAPPPTTAGSELAMMRNVRQSSHSILSNSVLFSVHVKLWNTPLVGVFANSSNDRAIPLPIGHASGPAIE
mmetsp:Transcript_15420/g.47715  ORF Transcript_15420/g.47715 Transcript_15420/m.47715 type:complete len:306 (+) Transcript_15420:3911-4828(+)